MAIKASFHLFDICTFLEKKHKWDSSLRRISIHKHLNQWRKIHLHISSGYSSEKSEVWRKRKELSFCWEYYSRIFHQTFLYITNTWINLLVNGSCFHDVLVPQHCELSDYHFIVDNFVMFTAVLFCVSTLVLEVMKEIFQLWCFCFKRG